jgi:hypothetical protein
LRALHLGGARPTQAASSGGSAAHPHRGQPRCPPAACPAAAWHPGAVRSGAAPGWRAWAGRRRPRARAWLLLQPWTCTVAVADAQSGPGWRLGAPRGGS